MARKTEHLKDTQFKRGQSGNPKGRPPGRSMTDRLRSVMDRPLTPPLRRQLAAYLGIHIMDTLPAELDDADFGDLIVARLTYNAYAGKDMSAPVDITERLDGKPVQPISGPKGEPLPTGSSNVLVITVTGEEDEAR